MKNDTPNTIKDYTCHIVDIGKFSDDIVGLRLGFEQYAKPYLVGQKPDIKSGQFAMIQIPNRKDLLLRRAFCIASYDPRQGIFEIVFRVVGEGTAQLATVQKGDTLQVLLPLGNGWQLDNLPYKNPNNHPNPSNQNSPYPNNSNPATPNARNNQPTTNKDKKNIWLVGGGLGVIPLISLPKEYPQHQYTHILGFKNASDASLTYCFTNPIITTDDGSVGTKGYVTDTIQKLIQQSPKPDLILACGSTPLLKALQNLPCIAQIPTFVSLEQRMACGLGACMTCTTDIGNQKLRVCKEGPIFDLQSVQL